MESQKAFQRLISQLPKDFRVLDVGAGGLHGENTTDFLAERFEKLTGVCLSEKEVAVYHAQRAEKGLRPVEIVIGDYYETEFKEKFDLIVADLTIELNLMRDWSDEGLARVRGMLKDEGYLIQYVMTTDQYGDPNETPALIRKYWKEFWGVEELTYEAIGKRIERIKEFDLVAVAQEERRPYILWILLKSGS